jgi:hypothetical protein
MSIIYNECSLSIGCISYLWISLTYGDQQKLYYSQTKSVEYRLLMKTGKRHSCTHAKGGINNQSLITGFSITILVPITQFREPLKIYELPKRLAI